MYTYVYIYIYIYMYSPRVKTYSRVPSPRRSTSPFSDRVIITFAMHIAINNTTPSIYGANDNQQH